MGNGIVTYAKRAVAGTRSRSGRLNLILETAVGDRSVLYGNLAREHIGNVLHAGHVRDGLAPAYLPQRGDKTIRRSGAAHSQEPCYPTAFGLIRLSRVVEKPLSQTARIEIAPRLEAVTLGPCWSRKKGRRRKGTTLGTSGFGCATHTHSKSAALLSPNVIPPSAGDPEKCLPWRSSSSPQTVE
jgi:hypothetical protein